MPEKQLSAASGYSIGISATSRGRARTTGGQSLNQRGQLSSPGQALLPLGSEREEQVDWVLAR